LMSGGDIGGDAQIGAFVALLAHTDTKLDVFLRRSVTIGENTYGHIFLYRSSDAGTTWEEIGDLIPTLEAHTYRIAVPANFYEITGNFAVAISEVSAPSPIHIVPMSFGTV